MRADGRTDGHHVTAQFSRIDGLPYYLKYGDSASALRALEFHYKKICKNIITSSGKEIKQFIAVIPITIKEFRDRFYQNERKYHILIINNSLYQTLYIFIKSFR